MRLNSFMSWIGGKKALRELIVTLFPVYYERYIEVFGGGGWVLFHKPPGNDFEVYNDFNSLLVNLYRCVRDKPQELMEALRYVLNSREDFDVVRATLARDSPASDVQKAAWFYELIRYSYAAGLTSFGSQPHDMWSNFPLIEQAHRRLAKVVIENKDFEKLIRQYDRPASLFYLDPPYHATEDYYQNIGEDGFTETDHIRLRDALMRIEGIRIIELLRFLYQQTDEVHAVTVSEMIEYLKSKGIPSVRQTVYTDLEALDTAGIDIVQIKSTQNRYFIGSRIFEYPELKMLVDAVESSKVISAKKSQALIQKLGQLTSIQQAEQLQRLASLSSRVKPHNEKVYYIIDSIQTAITMRRCSIGSLESTKSCSLIMPGAGNPVP